jgi:hypothetical protein
MGGLETADLDRRFRRSRFALRQTMKTTWLSPTRSATSVRLLRVDGA